MTNKFWPFFLGLIVSASLLWPLFAAPYFSHHDDVEVIRLYEIDKCFKDKQIPCRWVPDLGGLYGYPIFNYYAPFPYYFGEIVFFITNNLINSVKIIFATAFIGSFIFMYLFARKYWGDWGGSLSAIFYEFAPYHAVDFYVRGAMGEIWSLMFFPAILWALTRLEEKTNITGLLLSAIFITLLIISHNLSALIFLPVAIFYVLLLFFKRRQIKFLWFSFFSLVLGILLSAFYLLPMIFEKDLVHVESTTYGYFSYTEHFKGFRKLFLDRSWGWGTSVREVPGGQKDGMSYQIGWIHLLGWLLALIGIKYFWKKNQWIAKVVIFFTIISFFSIFMVNPRSEILWKLVQPLKYLQFPWRFLLLIIFSISFISGSIMLYVSRKKMFWIVLVLTVILFNFSYFRPEKFIQTSNEKLLSGQDLERQIKRSIFDYLPQSAKEPPANLAPSRYQILTGDTAITDFQQGTNWIKFKADTKTHSIIRLSQYYFPNWKITVDGKEIIFDYKNNTLGLMTFILGKGNHHIEARLYYTPIRSIANFMTISAVVTSAILFLGQLRQVRKWLSYYKKGIS